MRWRDLFFDAVTRRIASARFRNRASQSRLLAPIARRSAAQLFDLCAGFVYTQTLLACIRLGLLDLVDQRPRTPAEVARHGGLSTSAAETLLRAACAIGLLRARHDGTYGLGLQGAALIENPGVAAMIEHNALLYRDIADPVAFLRTSPPDGELARFWGYAANGDDAGLSRAQTEAYSQLMAVSQAMIAEEVLAAFSFSGHRRLLDVGGGHGAFATAVAQRWPKLDIVVFDLPGVVEGARDAALAAGLTQVRTHGGDFLRDGLPPGADVISLVRVLHDHDDSVVLRLLEAAAHALEPGGTLLVAEPMRGEGAQARVADAYFGFYLRGMGRGRARSVEEIEALMHRAGFADVHRRSTKVSLLASVVVGKCTRERQNKLTQ